MKRFIAALSLAFLAVSASTHATVHPTKVGKAAMSRSPYRLVGQLFFSSGGDDYIGSGVVIRTKSILTAGHNLYDPDTGWSTDLLFRRAAHGDTVGSEHYGKRIYLLGGYRQSVNRHGVTSVRSFASDTGGVRFGTALADGASAAWKAKPSLVTSSDRYKLAVGYGAEGRNTGDFPLSVVPDQGFRSTWGSFYESRGAYFEGGMSGGPVFAAGNNGSLFVTGIIVSGSDEPYSSGGIRVIDSTTANFIWNYLR